MIKSLLSFIVLILISSNSLGTENPDLSTLTAKTIDGKIIKLGDIIGKKPVYLKFWATWCIPCRKQMPHLQHSHEQYGKQIETLAVNININDSLGAIKKTQQEFQLSVPIVIDEDAVLAQAFNLIATPYHVLIDKEGKIIHTEHDATPELDLKLKLLAENKARHMQPVTFNKNTTEKTAFKLASNQTTMLFFTSAWCDWYLEKSRPDMSSACIEAQKTVNTLSTQYPNLNWQGVVTRLWTGEKELNDYIKKYQVPFTMSVDTENKHFFDFKVNTFPTLIAFQNGKEIFRTKQFSNVSTLRTKIKSLTAMPAK